MKKVGLLITGLLGLVLGFAGLVIAKYMITNYAFSQTQTHRSHLVRYVALFLLLVGLALIVLYALKSTKPSARSKS
jgi:putative copper export protein